jgi:F0F1-type ATP synthase assembly protein I
VSPSEPTDNSWVKGLGLYLVALTDLVGFTGAGLALGYFLYAKAGAPAWVMIPLALAGLALASWSIYRAVQALDRREGGS